MSLVSCSKSQKQVNHSVGFESGVYVVWAYHNTFPMKRMSWLCDFHNHFFQILLKNQIIDKNTILRHPDRKEKKLNHPCLQILFL